MKRILLFLLLASSVFAQNHTEMTLEDNQTISGQKTFSQLIPKSYTVATLPAASTVSGVTVVVIDAAQAGSCTSGGGTALSFCRSNGTTWVGLGDGGSGSGGMFAITNYGAKADGVTDDCAAFQALATAVNAFTGSGRPTVSFALPVGGQFYKVGNSTSCPINFNIPVYIDGGGATLDLEGSNADGIGIGPSGQSGFVSTQEATYELANLSIIGGTHLTNSLIDLRAYVSSSSFHNLNFYNAGAAAGANWMLKCEGGNNEVSIRTIWNWDNDGLSGRNGISCYDVLGTGSDTVQITDLHLIGAGVPPGFGTNCQGVALKLGGNSTSLTQSSIYGWNVQTWLYAGFPGVDGYKIKIGPGVAYDTVACANGSVIAPIQIGVPGQASTFTALHIIDNDSVGHVQDTAFIAGYPGAGLVTFNYPTFRGNHAATASVFSNFSNYSSDIKPTYPVNSLRNNLTGAVGRTFTVSSGVTINAFGRFWYASNSQNHQITLWDTTGPVLLAQATVLNASTSDAYGRKWVVISPLTLQTGHTYAITSDETNLGDQFQNTWAPGSNGGMASPFTDVGSAWIGVQGTFPTNQVSDSLTYSSPLMGVIQIGNGTVYDNTDFTFPTGLLQSVSFNAGNLVLIPGGTVNPQQVNYQSYKFTDLASLALPNGTTIFCVDCKNVATDAVTFDSAAASGGTGTTLLRENGAWRVH